MYVEIFRRTTSRPARASFDRGPRIITSWFPSITTITVDEARRSSQHVYAIIRTIRRGLKLRCPEATLDPDWKLRTTVDVYARSSRTCYLDLTTRLRRVLKMRTLEISISAFLAYFRRSQRYPLPWENVLKLENKKKIKFDFIRR